MIVKMSKYDFVLFHGQKEDFLNKLQDLGLVDITIKGWEPDEGERELMTSIEKHRSAITRLKGLMAQEGFEPGKPYADGEEAFNEYLKAATEDDALAARIAQAEKEAEELKAWGDFDYEKIAELEKQGISLRYFSTYSKEFGKESSAWNDLYNIVPIHDNGSMTYFVAVTSPGEEVMINAQEIKTPDTTFRNKEAEVEKMEVRRAELAKELARAAVSVDMIKEHGEKLEERLHFSQAAGSAREEAEGTLVIMEGWATKETAGKVDQLLESYPNLFYIKSDPTPDDDTPTVLKNKKFSSMFETIGNFYALPRYGTMDLTKFFAPFYLLFFGLCLADAGYGSLLAIGGFIIMKKKPKLKSIGRLAIYLGFSTIVCGLLMGSIFGIPYTDYGPFVRFREYILDSDKMFYIALGIGVIQILFGMSLKIYKKIAMYGLKYALSTIGWMLVLVTMLAALLGPKIGFPMPSYLTYTLAGLGLFLMLFMNSPGKNPFVNFGAGLWNTYNDVVGFVGDFLSYIRLFAIGLSGGVLALVFNQLALGLSPDIPVVKQLVMIIILLIGHGINLFMSTISAFVHPMRLTFVEFYNNADFEATLREFKPLKRVKQD